MSDKGEFIDDWELDDDEPCVSCGSKLHWRRWRRHETGEERVLHKCWDCGDAWWTDG
jgi:predicted RNA-binding Zn-ribbon protein involved in translation (DUF1610 family)